jgi:hypothetical protein
MNALRVIEAARSIDEREKALKWLTEFGVQLTGRGDVDVSVRLDFAGSCPGAKEAQSVIASYARLNIQTAVQNAIDCCRNDIAIHTDAIREEIGATP